MAVARSNQKKNSDQWMFPTHRFSTSAVELLVTNRYLDASESLYEKATATHIYLHMWNDQLQIWQLRQKRSQNWIIRELDSDRWRVMDIFKKAVQGELKSLESRYSRLIS